MHEKLEKELLIIQLNEMNFDYAKYYIDKYNLDNLKKLTNLNNCLTYSETDYEKLEPWIQWVTFNTGKSADQHEIFRLGDVNKLKFKQIYERIEELGYGVGAISPMNTDNRLKSPRFFISDPWTMTSGDNNYFHNLLSKCLSKVVNNNSKKKIGFSNYIILIISILRYLRISRYPYFIKLLFSSIKKSWHKVFILELLLHELYFKCLKNSKTNFSSIFFNGIAHIQHHYFFNMENFTSRKNPDWYLSSNYDPFRETLFFYNKILGDYFNLGKNFLVITGLSQKPYDMEKYYYRLNSPDSFFNLLKLNYKNIKTRMTRDFLVEFSNKEDAIKAQGVLYNLVDKNGVNLFNELDLKGDTLFVTLTYPHKIDREFELKINDKKVLFYKYVSFVALKNGMHNGRGFVFSNIKKFFNTGEVVDLRDFYKKIENYFLA
tara:strand:- start:1011 stop:2306 length:1296 start_codon:yes stop_codon:yes gene_type:complete